MYMSLRSYSPLVHRILWRWALAYLCVAPSPCHIRYCSTSIQQLVMHDRYQYIICYCLAPTSLLYDESPILLMHAINIILAGACHRCHTRFCVTRNLILAVHTIDPSAYLAHCIDLTLAYVRRLHSNCSCAWHRPCARYCMAPDDIRPCMALSLHRMTSNSYSLSHILDPMFAHSRHQQRTEYVVTKSSCSISHGIDLALNHAWRRAHTRSSIESNTYAPMHEMHLLHRTHVYMHVVNPLLV